jgi:anti-sigma factor RsiW
MNCKRIRSRLDLLAGDDLAGRDAAEVEAHLRRCLACYREYVEMRDLLSAVRGASRPEAVALSREPAEDFVHGVMSRIQGPPPPAPRLLPRLTMVSGWAAALVLGLTVGWYRWQLNGPDGRRDASSGVKDPTVVEQRIDRDLRDQLDEILAPSRTPASRRADDVKTVVHRSTKSY